MDISFKERPAELPDNRVMAEHRLHLLGKRLQKNKGILLSPRYIASVHELLEKGYMLSLWQMIIWKVERKPDNCILVYDCAAKYQGVSLNDKVHQGPDLTNGLVGVLLRFRQEPIALMADIQGMFNQVYVSENGEKMMTRLRLHWCTGWKPTSLEECGPPVVATLCLHSW